MLINIEHDIAELFGYSHAVLFGRARSAITALLEILAVNRDYSFIMPSNLCPSMFTTVWSTGTNIKLAPVSELNGIVDDSKYVEELKKSSGNGIVMPTHLYGFVNDYNDTVKLAKEKNWFILENDCLATKARVELYNSPKPIGDALLVSFGYSKTIDVGLGGALVTNDKNLAQELKKRANKYIELDALALKKEDWLMKTRRILREGPPGGESYTHLSEHLMEMEISELRYAFPVNHIDKLQQEILNLEKKISRRLEKVDIWKTLMTNIGDEIIFPNLEQVVPWRFICRVPNKRDSLVKILRDKGIDAGTNYAPLTEYFPSLLNNQWHESSINWGKEVLNLWLTNEYDIKLIKDVVGLIEEHCAS